MRVVIVIPARLESSRLPNKLLLSETGQPLILHTVQAAKERFGRVVVATDSQQIRDVVRKSAEVIMTGNCSSGTERVRVALAGDMDVNSDTIIVNWQGDEPELDSLHVLDLAYACTRHDVEVATLAAPATLEEYQSPDVVKTVLDHDDLAMYFSRCPIPYNQPENALKHMGIYAFTYETLMATATLDQTTYSGESLEQLTWLQAGYRIKVLTRSVPYVGIDTREEYEAFVKRHVKI